MMAYLCEATLIGVGSSIDPSWRRTLLTKEKIITTQRRKAAMLILILAFVLESCLLFMAEIKIPNRDAPLTTFWWHDNVLNARHILFALLPLAVHFVPNFRIPFLSRPSPPSIADTSSNLVQAHQTLSHLVSALHLLKYGQAATMRVPELRERASNWWEEEAKVGAWIREDGLDEPDSATSVNNVARRLGISFDRGSEGVEEGKLRTSAKLTTKVLMIDGLKSTPHLQAQPDQRE
ncbi:hypothetical protein H0H93_009678 [Arthromyces matolae]|nr:hypothetical protein H0H93_009678 [Arthromyces matolae]